MACALLPVMRGADRGQRSYISGNLPPAIPGGPRTVQAWGTIYRQLLLDKQCLAWLPPGTLHRRIALQNGPWIGALV